MQKWEYRVEEVKGTIPRASLRIIGNAGWELIAVIKDPANEKGYVYYFKRPISN